MNMDNPYAAGQGGSGPAPQSQDELKRQSAVETLAAMLATSMAMLSRCEAQANVSRGDRLGPVYAAAQLLHANANIAKALAQVGCVETRHRSIVERIQTPDARPGELISGGPPPPSVVEHDEARANLERRLDALLEADRREQKRQEGLAIGSSI